MENKKYLTVAEYARIRGVSTTAVYKKLDRSLKPWVEVVNGRKCLKISILHEDGEKWFYGLKGQINEVVEEIDNTINNKITTDSNSLENVENGSEPTVESLPGNRTSGEDSELVKELREQVAFLRKEYEEQRERITEKDRQLADYAARFATLAEQAQELAGRAQALHAADTMPALLKETGTDDGHDSSELTPVENTVIDHTDEIPPAVEPTKKRRSFWQWLTGAD